MPKRASRPPLLSVADKQEAASQLALKLALKECRALEVPSEQAPTLANMLGREIPYHPEWYKAYPVRVANYEAADVAAQIAHDVARYEKQYPQFFSAEATGHQLVFTVLVKVHKAHRRKVQTELDRLRNLMDEYEDSSLAPAIKWLGALKTVAPKPSDFLPPLLPLSATQPLEWEGSKAELAELAYGLIESKRLKSVGGRGRTVAALAAVFGLSMTKPERQLQTIQNRPEAMSFTPLFDDAKAAFLKFLES